ncbi:hypothetical protein SynPROSU1_01623 [Synechococcus sp. PROS-U-1]|nr:hypothetical protein SynPROSU1_01623 [Synechococcus sp. PROS-U-1]
MKTPSSRWPEHCISQQQQSLRRLPRQLIGARKRPLMDF